MAEWIVRDDDRYRRWLLKNPGGFVLNTWATPKASYLVLHKASCRSVNRPSDRRSWTVQYGQAVSASAADLSSWAHDATGGVPRDCRPCGSSDSHRLKGPSSRLPLLATDYTGSSTQGEASSSMSVSLVSSAGPRS